MLFDLPFRGVGVNRILGRDRNPNQIAEVQRQQRQANEKRSAQAKRLWLETTQLRGTCAELYLRNRAITCTLPDSLRFAQTCWHQSARRVPALIGKVTGADGFAVHRTYLHNNGYGKSTMTPNKAMLGPTKGGAVHLSNAHGRLVVTEGIETGLSLISGLIDGPISVWAALSASGVAALRLPDRVGKLLIASDGDKIGRDAAKSLATRAYGVGWTVSILDAPDGRDWNDVLMTEALAQ